jgi:hypothetical protein
MKHLFKTKIMVAFSMIFTFAAANQSYAQCSIVGLSDQYCLDAEPVYLLADPLGGTFSGPGVEDGIFDPEAAGVGVHTITYEFFSGADRYYIKTNTLGEPWGSSTNINSMNDAFGPGEWIAANFETVDVAAVFSVETSCVFLEGSDGGANELNSFLTANLTAIEEWVFAGGVVLINAAPNEGGNINFGFDGSMLVYDGGTGSVTAADAAHPAFVGPIVPTATTMTGSNYTHGRITGTGFTSILTHSGAPSSVSLCEKEWGAGTVIMGGMTTSNWHSPSPQGHNFRTNLFVYMDEIVESGVACIATTEVEVLDEVSPDIVATVDFDEVCAGNPYTLTGSGADDFYWGGGIVDGDPITQDVAGTYTHLLTGISDAGCVGTSLVTVTVHPNPVVDAGLDMTQCVEMELTLNGAGADTYEWDPAVIDGEPFAVSEGLTTYTVTGTTEFGCEGTDEMVVEGIGVPVVTAVITDEYELFGASIDITVTGGVGPYGYAWSHGPTTEDVTGLYEGTYTVDVSDSGVEEGICPPVSETYTIIRFVGVEDLTENTLTVYPTPVNDNLTISYTGDFNYELTAINGDIIFSGKAVDQEIISMDELSAGTYLIKVTSNGEVTTKKIVKQ